MIATRTLLIIGACVLGAAAQDPAERLPEARDVLARLEAETGTPEARGRITSLVAKGTLTAKGMPMEAALSELYLGPNSAKSTVTMKGMGDMSMGTMGDLTWSTDPAMGVMVKEGADQGAAKRLFGIVWRAPWTEMYSSAKTVGQASVDDRPCWKLAMSAGKDDDDTWYVDRETHRLARVDLELPDMLGGKMDVRLRLSDWRRERGVLYAFKRTQEVGPMTVHYVWTEMSLNSEVDPVRVQPSARVQKAIRERTLARTTPPEPFTGEVETLAERHVASIRVKIAPTDVGRTLAIALPEVMEYLTKVGATPAGPPFSRFHGQTDTELDIEAGIPVREPITGADRVKPSKLPGGRVATLWHFGPYEELPGSYTLLEKWITDHGHAAAGPIWGFYWTDPGLEPDEKKWKTQLVCPLK